MFRRDSDSSALASPRLGSPHHSGLFPPAVRSPPLLSLELRTVVEVCTERGLLCISYGAMVLAPLTKEKS
ncbi:hypothetical protein JRQ81_004476 [Phrynocephalus forsythii]|uniref:Uncharacterized protein n=1 Tax=Phrynocephalus forsythii TaxID=171643 RepID=A0A9Q0Y251_9SAUR|nr:hypothetical protein JRQ81_004476 [Phrynocephalus forsythii]